MKAIKFLIPIICSLTWAQELKINNEYVFSSTDSILIEKVVEIEIIDTTYYKNEWERISIDNKLNITLTNNQDKPLLFYLDPLNINTENMDSMFIYENNIPNFEISIFNKQNKKVNSTFLAYNVLERIEYYGNSMEKNSFLNKGNWQSIDNKYEDPDFYLYVLKPGEKVLLFIDLRLPADNTLTRPYTYDFSNFDLDTMKIIFCQDAEKLKNILTKQTLEKLKKDKIEIFDGVLESNNVKIIELRR